MSERFKRPVGYEEQEDDSRISDIRSKISSLKAVSFISFLIILYLFKISIDIGSEVREHNSLLDRMVSKSFHFLVLF